MFQRQIWYSHNELQQILKAQKDKNFLKIFVAFIIGLIIGLLIK